eukprot:6206461-Prymnesium_polylepis.1
MSHSEEDSVDNSCSGVVFVCCSRVDALSHARVLRSELSVRLGRRCALGGGADTAGLIEKCELCVVLLTRQLTTDHNALYEIWTALSAGLRLATVMVSGAGCKSEPL